MKNIEICPCCGQKIIAYKYRFNNSLLDCLITLRFKNGLKIAEMGLRNAHYSSFHKLKYFGLMARAGSKNFITPLGLDFIDAKATIPEWVMVKKGEVVETSKNYIYFWEATKETDMREFYAMQVKEAFND